MSLPTGAVAKRSGNGVAGDDRVGADEESTTEYAPIVASMVQRGREALALLAEGYACAGDVGRSVWDFAIRIDVLQSAGLSTNALRWMTCRGFAEHRRESSPSPDGKRRFEPAAGLTFAAETCFVLTSEGARFALEWMDHGSPAPSASKPSRCADLRPTWDRDRQELRLGDRVVKRFRAPAPNQERVLAAFEEEGWPVRIDDPLPPVGDQEPKKRLHDTIAALNNRQIAALVRFRGDGSGQGVRWCAIDFDESNGRATA